MKNLKEKQLKQEVLNQRSEKLVKLESQLIKLKLKRVWLSDWSGYWFERNFKGKYFKYRLISEPDWGLLFLQIEVYIDPSIGSKDKQFEDIYRFKGKISEDRVKRVIKMIK